MCGYPGYNTEQSGAKLCPTVSSVLVANIQVTNIGECSVGFKGCFLNAQYNRSNNITFSNKCCFCLLKMGTQQGRRIDSRLCVCGKELPSNQTTVSFLWKNTVTTHL